MPLPPPVQKTGYQNFGSFHTENVEELIHNPAYSPPENPFLDPADFTDLQNVDFGVSLRQYFLIDFNSWTFINHGAFGAVIKPALAESNKWREYCELQPLKFLDRDANSIVELVAASMPDNTKLAVFDAVTSNTGLVLPLEQLIELCHERGIAVMVDGAHALGQLDLHLGELRPDFFVSNCHKWLCGPRGSAILWVAPERKPLIRPLVVSHGSGCGFTSDFIWDGCRDYAPYLAVSSALRFWRAIGPPRARQYMRSLLAEAVQLLSSRWDTSTLVPLSMCAAMALVRLPFGCGQADPASSEDAKYIQDLLHSEHAVEAPVKCIQGQLYVRISAHVYNQIEDYQKLAEAVMAVRAHAQSMQRTVSADSAEEEGWQGYNPYSGWSSVYHKF